MLDDLKQGNRFIGLKQSTRAVGEGIVIKAFVANDSAPTIFEKFVELCQKKDVPVEYVPTMKELGEVCKIDVGATVAVLIKEQ